MNKKQLPDWIQDQVSSYHENQTDLDKTFPYIDDKAIQKMDMAMQGPIGVARTSYNVMTSTPIKASQASSLRILFLFLLCCHPPLLSVDPLCN